MKMDFEHLKPFNDKMRCIPCDEFKMQLKPKILSAERKNEIHVEEEKHLAIVRAFKQNFLELIEPTAEVEVITFELQRALEMPFKTIDESYEWSQLWCSNVCIYDEVCSKPHMYFWEESVAKRGPEQIASCILQYILKVVSKGTKKLILFSKACPFNRNIKVILMLAKLFDYLKSLSLETVELKFSIRGHDFNACNDCFSAIEKRRKSIQSLFVPKHWLNIIAESKQKCSRADVSKMTKDTFFSVEKHMPFINTTLDWSSFEGIVMNRTDPTTIDISNRGDERITYKITNLSLAEFQNTPLIYSNLNGNAISNTKYENLQKILKFIPDEHHTFYKKLKHDENIQDFSLVQNYDE